MQGAARSARDRIITLFARRQPTYAARDVITLLGISEEQLADLIANGTIATETNERGTVVIPWADVALLALEEWTPRMIHAALRNEEEPGIPLLNEQRLIRVSLPIYLIRLLDYLARAESGTRNVPRNASDVLERILHDFANAQDVAAVDAAVPGFEQALTYPSFVPRRTGLVWRRCRYCGTSISEPIREVCEPCIRRHEPEEHLGEYGLPELDEPPAQADTRAADVGPVITIEHGRRYADRWREDPSDAFQATGLLPWPDEPAAQLQIHEIEDAIEERLWPEVRDAIARAFVKAATAVLADRERRSVPDGDQHD